MRPALKAGLLPVWRSRDTIQIGIDPRRAIAVTGMRGAGALLRLLDGSRDRGQVLTAARDLGLDPDTADRVLTLLAAGGALDDVPAAAGGLTPAGLRTRLAPELATATLAHQDTDGGARTLARRQGACVRVHGASQAAVRIAGLLTAAGTGLVLSTGLGPAGPPGPAAPPQTTPGQRAPARGSPGAGPGRRQPGLVILADSHRRELPAGLLRSQIPHLVVSAGEAIGVVGPLVLPGRSACLRCLDLTRAEQDPAWPLILAQLAGRAAAPAACDCVLATTVAAQAAAQALAFVDRGAAATAVVNGTLDLVLPAWQWRRRTWPPHPRCGCRSPG